MIVVVAPSRRTAMPANAPWLRAEATPVPAISRPTSRGPQWKRASSHRPSTDHSAEEARKPKKITPKARLLLLSAWEESTMYSERERAALAWTEALTKVSETHAPDDVYNEVRRVFSEEETIKLSIAIAMINAWNRLSIGFRAQHPADRKLAA